MSANLGLLRWYSAAVAAACYDVRDLAPALGSLLYEPAVPERSLQTLLDWADVAADPATMGAFELTSIRAVLPAMVEAYVATHTYRFEASADQTKAPDRLILEDAGYGAVIARIMMLLTEVIAPVHGSKGRACAEESRSDLAEQLFAQVDRLRRN
jgi:hypothetical protein